MKRLIAPLILIVFMAAGAAAGEKVGPVQIGNRKLPLVTADGAELYFAYYGEDNGLYVFRKGDGKVAKIEKKGYAGSHVWLGFTDDEILLVWQVKESSTGHKYVLLQRADKADMDFSKSKPVIVSRARDALLPIKIMMDGDNIFIAWSDERVQNMPVYMNYSTDGGRTFQEDDVDMTPGYSTNLNEIIKSGGRYYFFSHGKKPGEDNTSIYVRESDDGKSWSEIKQIRELDEWAPYTINAYGTKAGPLVFWGGVKGLYYAYKDEEGQWQDKVVSGTQGSDINRFTVAAGTDGKIHIAASYRKWQARKLKANVFVFSSSDQGRTWGKAVKLNRNIYSNTSSFFPDMHVADDGLVVVTWLDHRLIRGNVYVNYSLDGGGTWLEEDINFEPEPGARNSFFPYAVGAGDKIYIVWLRYVDDALYGPRDIMLKELKIKGGNVK